MHIHGSLYLSSSCCFQCTIKKGIIQYTYSGLLHSLFLSGNALRAPIYFSKLILRFRNKFPCSLFACTTFCLSELTRSLWDTEWSHLQNRYCSFSHNYVYFFFKRSWITREGTAQIFLWGDDKILWLIWTPNESFYCRSLQNCYPFPFINSVVWQEWCSFSWK